MLVVQGRLSIAHVKVYKYVRGQAQETTLSVQHRLVRLARLVRILVILSNVPVREDKLVVVWILRVTQRMVNGFVNALQEKLGVELFVISRLLCFKK